MKNGKWPTAQLGKHVDLLCGFAFKSKDFTDDPNDIPLVKGANVHQGYIDWADSKYWPRTDAADYTRYFLEADDVVLAMDRPWIEAGLKFPWIRKHHPQALLVQRVARMRGINGLHSRHLRFVIGSHFFTDYIKPIVTGINVPYISADQIKGFSFSLPPEHAQRKIAGVLSAYDDLIENNTRRIAIVEEMAQAIYREWFVHFRFPGHDKVKLINSPLGKIPEGWKVVTIEELATHSPKGITPAQYPEEEFAHFSIPNYDKGQLPELETGATIQSNKFAVLSGCVMLSKLNPRIPRIWLPEPHGDYRPVASTEFLIVSPLAPATREFIYCQFQSDDFAGRFRSCSSGTSTSHQRVKPTDFVKLKALLPPSSVIDWFTNHVGPMCQLIHNRRIHNRNLRTTRDLLLPKLLSGQLDVEELDIDAGEPLVEGGA